MLENKIFFIIKKITNVILILFLLSYTIFGIIGKVKAASYKQTYTQTVKTGIDAFPESYKPFLRKIKEQHPNWTFDAYFTGISWSDLVKYETDHGHNRIINSADSLLKCSCGKWICMCIF